MKPEGSKNLEELFHAARYLEAEKRSAFLDEACAGDAALRLRLERMLAENPDDDSLLGKPAMDIVSAMKPSATPQDIPPGTLLEHYRIRSVVGAGGMGTVYGARDLKLDRDVAIKVLPPALTMDPERLPRFEREARILASLNHPNIGAIYGLAEGEGVRALVLELVEGPTLADRLESGPIPVREALMIARQVADALDAAHSSGVIHRDLKPANIKIRPDGTVKVLDFGIAKAGIRDVSDSLTNLPTGPIEATGQGVILGTPAYMSPEQARGQSLDKRSDIWAFGCVLYEMLTGRRTFSGATLTDVLAAILEREPDWGLWPEAIPPNVTRLVRRCLEKDPRQRLRDMGDARFELSEQTDDGKPSATVSARHSWWRTVLLAAAAVTISVIATWRLIPSPPAQPQLVERFPISIAPAVDFGRPVTTNITVSPDGRLIVFSALSHRPDGSGLEAKLYLRSIDKLDAEPIRGTEGGSNPVFSPDGNAVAFRAGRKLMVVDLDGTPPVELASVAGDGVAVGHSWFSNGDLLFADYGRGLSRTQPNGKKPIPVTKVDLEKGERHVFPLVLPGDDTILFTIVPPSGRADAEIVAQSLSDDETRQTLVRGGVDARYVPPGFLVYLKSDTLMAVRFDPKTLKTGQEVPVLENVRVSLIGPTPGGSTLAGQFAVSSSGSLVWVGGGASPDPVSTLVWVNRDGEAQPINAPVRSYRSPRLSPDGKRISHTSQENGARDIFVYNLSSEFSRKQTYRYENTSAVWSPDGTRLAFSSTANSYRNVFWTVVNGSNTPEPLTTNENGNAQDPMSWFGNYLLYTERRERQDIGSGRRAIMLLTVGENRTATWLEPRGTYELRHPEFDPDGRYVAYSSNENGKWEVYVRPFQGDEPGIPVGDGAEPAWSSGGELFYRSGEKVMAAEIRTTPVLEVRKRTELFTDIYETADGRPSRNYDVTSDGRQFLMVKPNPEALEPPTTNLTMVRNWIEDLQDRLSEPGK